MRKMRKGFTLVELLVVISVLGALAAMMSMSGSEALTSAKTANIISNLRSFVAATHEYYVDNLDQWYGKTTKPAITEIRKYMNKGISENTNAPHEAVLTNYVIATEDPKDSSYAEVDWYIGYTLPTSVSAAELAALKAKLKGRANAVGLYGGTAENDVIASPAIYDGGTSAVIWMKAHEKSQRTS